MVYKNTIIEGNVKFRDGRKWKPRWCVMRKLSPVADCLHLQLYRDSKDHFRQGQTKASLSLQHFLAIETGFTLDKESNTLAIICQDVTVVLAFDSRELLIQWQVKVANNLGEDHQILVQVASAPARSKISPGPAHLHIREYKFCLTSGLPPRLLGFWEISHLRKYGVVDGRFCFEGGSQCGRCEGLYVLITNQCEEISRALHLASEGKPVCQKRLVSRNISVLESPRRSNHWRTESRLGGAETSNLHQSCAELTTQHGLHSSHIIYGSDNFPWFSSETRPDSSDFGDSISFADRSHCSHQDWHDGNQDTCSNCASEFCSSPWNASTHKSKAHAGCCSDTVSHSSQLPFQGLPVQDGTFQEKFDWSKFPVSENCDCCPGSHNSRILNNGSPIRSKKCCSRLHSPFPDTVSAGCSSPKGFETVQSYYDSPKRTAHSLTKEQVSSSLPTEENYDTPRSIKEKSSSIPQQQYSNYDTPPSVHHLHQPLPIKTHCTRVVMEHEDCRLMLCPCQQIFGWIPLPYCYRGYGIENTAAQFCKVKLLNEKIQPNASQITFPSQLSHKSEETFKETEDLASSNSCSQQDQNNSEMIPHSQSLKASPKVHNKVTTNNGVNSTSSENCTTATQLNYANMEFAESLEFYENSRDLIKRSGLDKENKNTITDRSRKPYEIKEQSDEEEKLGFRNNKSSEKVKPLFCSKCGHACKNDIQGYNQSSKVEDEHGKQDDYTLMYPDEFKSRNQLCNRESINYTDDDTNDHPEYLHMSPLTNVYGKTNETSSNEMYSQSVHNIPNFIEHSNDHPPVRIPGKAILCVEEDPQLPINSYLKRNFKFVKEEYIQSQNIPRKRSNSIDCSRYSDDNLYQYINFRREKNAAKNTMSPLLDKRSTNLSTALQTTLTHTLHNSLPENEARPNATCSDVVKQNVKKDRKVFIYDNPSCGLNFPPQVQVRRSSSVPCKTGNNRDSSSSNDSGVSAGSPKFQGELEQTSIKEVNHLFSAQGSCLHSSLPRKHKNHDPLQELSFHFQAVKTAGDSEVNPVSIERDPLKGFTSANVAVITQDSRSTSSATSDMSDYIETLSLSSYSSSDTPESLRLSRTAVITLKPRSGKEYHKVDRCILDIDSKKANNITVSSTVIPEKAESPSPGYSSGSPLNSSC